MAIGEACDLMISTPDANFVFVGSVVILRYVLRTFETAKSNLNLNQTVRQKMYECTWSSFVGEELHFGSWNTTLGD